MEKRTILHSDLNNFYASVEVLYDPALKGKPVAGDAEARYGIIPAKSYEAKAYGVRTGEALLCEASHNNTQPDFPANRLRTEFAQRQGIREHIAKTYPLPLSCEIDIRKQNPI